MARFFLARRAPQSQRAVANANTESEACKVLWQTLIPIVLKQPEELAQAAFYSLSLEDIYLNLSNWENWLNKDLAKYRKHLEAAPNRIGMLDIHLGTELITQEQRDKATHKQNQLRADLHAAAQWREALRLIGELRQQLTPLVRTAGAGAGTNA